MHFNLKVDIFRHVGQSWIFMVFPGGPLLVFGVCVWHFLAGGSGVGNFLVERWRKMGHLFPGLFVHLFFPVGHFAVLLFDVWFFSGVFTR